MSMDKDVAGAHYRTLKNRFSEKRLLEAAHRREHLQYRSLRIGDAPGSGKVKFLLAQMHQNYYFGSFETVCALGGIILEQALMYRLRRAVRERGPLAMEENGRRVWIQSPEDLFEHGVSSLLKLGHDEGLIKGKRLMQRAHELRWIRNMVVHEAMPFFVERDGGELEMRVIRSRSRPASHAMIRMKKQEVAGLSGKRGEITAYYCVSRLREILQSLLREERPRNGVTDESSGSLFHWEETGEDRRDLQGPHPGH
jgi:hypothetical protein